MRKARVIIANENKYVADLQIKFIKKIENIEILGIATNAQEEIELIEKCKPDIVITNVVRRNENINGLDIIKKYENNEDMKFILITALKLQDIILENDNIIPKNIIKYIKTPFECGKLYIEIEKALICISNRLAEDNDKFLNNYYTTEIINLCKFLNKKDKEILKELDISIENKKYTKYEFDKIIQQLNVYCQIHKEINQNIFKIDIYDIKKILNKFYTLEDEIIEKNN